MGPSEAISGLMRRCVSSMKGANSGGQGGGQPTHTHTVASISLRHKKNKISEISSSIQCGWFATAKIQGGAGLCLIISRYIEFPAIDVYEVTRYLIFVGYVQKTRTSGFFSLEDAPGSMQLVQVYLLICRYITSPYRCGGQWHTNGFDLHQLLQATSMLIGSLLLLPCASALCNQIRTWSSRNAKTGGPSNLTIMLAHQILDLGLVYQSHPNPIGGKTMLSFRLIVSVLR